MSRVLAVVSRSIMVHMDDVVEGDIVCVRGNESDPIIEKIERVNGLTRFHYKPRPGFFTDKTVWMDPNNEFGSALFIHDLKNERADFDGKKLLPDEDLLFFHGADMPAVQGVKINEEG